MAKLPLTSLLQQAALNREVTCLNCWHRFAPEMVQWISVHPKLVGEPQLPASATGQGEQKRFIPERFDVEGRALDPEGSPCTQVACPRCRLLIPRASLEMPSVILSVLGSPGSGKSVFLTSMVFTMRQQASRLGLRFQDADLTLNEQLLNEERKMFLDPGAETYRPISDAVEKTQVAGGRYRTSRIEGQDARFVPPYTFLVSPTAEHPRAAESQRLSRLLCLYDNAGESFRPGADSAATPMIRHMAASKGLIYIFDPTRDRRLRRKLRDRAVANPGADRQDLILVEAANRIREHAMLAQHAAIPQPLVVVLSKFDAWRSLVPGFEDTKSLGPYPNSKIEALQADEVDAVSKVCEDFLKETCPEIVTSAQSVSEKVTYVPVAAVGWDVRADAESGPKFQAADCEPYGVLVPMLSLLSKTIPKIVPAVRRRSN